MLGAAVGSALGVEVGASLSTIKEAHRRLALENHPDKAQGRGASADEIEAAEKRLPRSARGVRDALGHPWEGLVIFLCWHLVAEA